MKKHRYKKKLTIGEVIFMIFLLIFSIAIYTALNIFNVPYADFAFAGIELLIIILISFHYSRKRSGKKYLKYDFNKLNSLSGEQFEELLKAYFKKSGYKVSLTQKSGDFGADLIVTKNGEKTIVQAKRYKGSVGISAVQEVIGAKEYYKGKKAMVITNSYFTPAAIELATKTKVILWDGKVVSRIIKNKKIPKI